MVRRQHCKRTGQHSAFSAIALILASLQSLSYCSLLCIARVSEEQNCILKQSRSVRQRDSCQFGPSECVAGAKGKESGTAC